MAHQFPVAAVTSYRTIGDLAQKCVLSQSWMSKVRNQLDWGEGGTVCFFQLLVARLVATSLPSAPVTTGPFPV